MLLIVETKFNHQTLSASEIRNIVYDIVVTQESEIRRLISKYVTNGLLYKHIATLKSDEEYVTVAAWKKVEDYDLYLEELKNSVGAQNSYLLMANLGLERVTTTRMMDETEFNEWAENNLTFHDIRI